MSARPHLRPVGEPDDEGRPAATGRVRLRFQPDGADVRVPAGTPIFDAASWNGIAIDSTCGGHGTCKKCKVRIVAGDGPGGAGGPRALSPKEPPGRWRPARPAPPPGGLLLGVAPPPTRAQGG